MGSNELSSDFERETEKAETFLIVNYFLSEINQSNVDYDKTDTFLLKWKFPDDKKKKVSTMLKNLTGWTVLEPKDSFYTYIITVRNINDLNENLENFKIY